MKLEIQKISGRPATRTQKIIGWAGLVALVAALAFSHRQYMAEQREFERQMAGGQVITRLSNLDRINYAIRMMNNGNVEVARRELQAVLGDDMRLIRSELPLVDPNVQSFANRLCFHVMRQQQALPDSLWPYPGNSMEAIDETVVKSTNFTVKSGI